jgi:hypothetical protein
MTGDCGIANASNILEWAEASLLDPVILQRCYNMDLSTAADLNFYLVALHNFASKAYAQSIFARNGGVTRQQSAFEWLFSTVDPLLHKLSPSQSNINYFKNWTWEKTQRAAMVDTMYTGKGALSRNPAAFALCYSLRIHSRISDNINRIMQYKSWRNQSSLAYSGRPVFPFLFDFPSCVRSESYFHRLDCYSWQEAAWPSTARLSASVSSRGE